MPPPIPKKRPPTVNQQIQMRQQKMQVQQKKQADANIAALQALEAAAPVMPKPMPKQPAPPPLPVAKMSLLDNFKAGWQKGASQWQNQSQEQEIPTQVVPEPEAEPVYVAHTPTPAPTSDLVKVMEILLKIILFFMFWPILIPWWVLKAMITAGSNSDESGSDSDNSNNGYLEPGSCRKLSTGASLLSMASVGAGTCFANQMRELHKQSGGSEACGEQKMLRLPNGQFEMVDANDPRLFQ